MRAPLGVGWPTAVLLGAALALLALVWWVRRRESRRLGALREAAERIGRGELARPILGPRGGEPGRLTEALEQLRRRLAGLSSDLKLQRAEAEAIVNGVVEGVFTVDRQRRIRFLNPQTARLLGIAPEQALGKFCGDVLRPRAHGGVRPCEESCPIVHARFRGGARGTEQLATVAGGTRTVVITSAPLAGELQVQVVRDESDVEASRRLRDAILANISHEFRTPLSAQLASIELLLDRLPELTREQIGELIGSQQRGALRLTQLIDNLLESVRIEAGEAKIRRQPVALDEVVEQALELTRPLLDQRRQEVRLELPPGLPLVVGDAARLTQVFVNLLGNANKFAPANSTVSIGGAGGAGEVTVWVEDQGPGLPEEEAGGPFGRFWRAGGEEPEQGGVGLGLYIAKSIVERHGGRIAAAAAGAGGARISVILPAEAPGEDPGRG